MWGGDFSSAVNMNGGLIFRVHGKENLTMGFINKQGCRSLQQWRRVRIEELDHLLSSPSFSINPRYLYHVVVEINCVNGVSACEREQTNLKYVVEAHDLLLLKGSRASDPCGCPFPTSFTIFLHGRM